MPDTSCFYCSRRQGRLALHLALRPQGRDWLASLTGGQAHIGAVALALPPEAPLSASQPLLLSRHGHREDALAQECARQLAAASDTAVCVCAGIHYDAISREEITTVLRLCEDMTTEAARWLRSRAPRPDSRSTHGPA